MRYQKIGIMGFSNPVSIESQKEIIDWLTSHRFEVYVSSSMNKDSTPQEKAAVFNDWMKTNDLDIVFDISGGDLANLVIPYIDMDAYQQAKTIYAGYSDNTCVINALLEKTNKPCLLFQIRNSSNKDEILSFLQGTSDSLCHYTYTSSYDIEGDIIGGNIRCLLKLAQTGYFPNCQDKILFLESYSGKKERILSYLTQLQMMGVFTQVKGVVFGQFTELLKSGQYDELKKFSMSIDKPVIWTQAIGHSCDSKALWIGKRTRFLKM